MKSAVFSGSTAPHVADVVVQWFQTLLRLIPKAAAIVVEYRLPAVCQDSVHTWADYDPGEQLHQLQVHLLPQNSHPVDINFPLLWVDNFHKSAEA